MDRIQNMVWWNTAARSIGGDFVIISDDLYDEFETFTYSRGHEKGYVPYRLNYVLRNESYRFHVVYT